MRTLRTETAGLPAGTPYQIEEVPDLGRCVSWRGPADRMTRVEKVGAVGTRAPLLYDAHVQSLGCNPEEMVPCGHCGCELAACLTMCNECGNDPDGDAECEECPASGYIDFCRGDGQRPHRETCGVCDGSGRVEGLHAGEREAALARAQAWQASRRENPVPAGIGGGR